MPLSTTITRHVMQPRKIAWFSATVGTAIFLLFIIITLILLWNRRVEHHDKLAQETRAVIAQGFAELNHTMRPLLDVTQFDCATINRDITERAAFSSTIRAILVVRDNLAFCSSATGTMDMDIALISPATQFDAPLDIRLLPETPMARNQPALAVWMGDPQHARSGILTTLNLNLTTYLLMAAHQPEVTGMAIIAGDHALTTWDQQVKPVNALPDEILKTITLPGIPLTFQLYGQTLSSRDLHIILLAGLLTGLLSGCACFLLMTLQLKPGKEILLGIKRGEFHVEYQPVIETLSGKTRGIEALLRWVHPTEGRIAPDSFISYAEAKNMIVPLTRHLFDLVARDAHTLRKAVPKGLSIGINISPKHIPHPGFRNDVKSWMDRMPEGHYQYIFEITERTMVEKQSASSMFDWIRRQGIRIAIDDFGTGHSALIYLEKFQFDHLKIDRGFVQSIGLETVTSPVLDTVLTLAKKLHLNTVAEGVETEEQAKWLSQRSVTHMQGYHFSRPLTVPQLITWFEHEDARGPVL